MGALKTGIATAIDGVETSMIDIKTIVAATAPTQAPEGNATDVTTVAPTDAPTQAVTDAPTPAPEENATAAPTPAPEENDNATRRLASGDVTISARFTDVPDAVTKALVESKASDIEAEINTALTNQGITISGLSATATDTPADASADPCALPF